MTKVCRICLKNTGNFTALFSNESASNEVLDKIFLCFQIILTHEEYLPSHICDVCIDELNTANNFRLKCISFEINYSVYLKNRSDKASFGENVESDIDKNDVIQGSDLNIENDEVLKLYSAIDLLNNFECNLCGKLLKTKNSLINHSKSMHTKRKYGRVTGSGINRLYHCTKCSYCTPHSQTLVNHMRRHDGEKPFQCECGKSFTQPSGLAAHRKTHSKTTYFTCSICGKQFKLSSSFKNHMSVHENGNFSCNICQKVLKTKKSLRDHLHRHFNVKNFSCEDCGDTFVTSSELLNHKRKHNIDKHVECNLCGYKTKTKKNLILHIKRHTGDKSHICKLCETAFYTAAELKRHHRTHTKDKPYPCPSCAQRFTHSPSLNKHMYAVHGVHFKWSDAKNKSNIN